MNSAFDYDALEFLLCRSETTSVARDKTSHCNIVMSTTITSYVRMVSQTLVTRLYRSRLACVCEALEISTVSYILPQNLLCRRRNIRRYAFDSSIFQTFTHILWLTFFPTVLFHLPFFLIILNSNSTFRSQKLTFPFCLFVRHKKQLTIKHFCQDSRVQFETLKRQ